MPTRPILIDGAWTEVAATRPVFHAFDPATGAALDEQFAVASRDDLARMADAASGAATTLQDLDGERIARFLDAIADGLEAEQEALVAVAHRETALPASPRLADVELPRTTNQLRRAADAARAGSWRDEAVDEEAGLRSRLESLGGAVLSIGPNNFPFAFNGASGGDFAAAIAAGNPVIAKAHPAHPGTSHRLAEIVDRAARDTEMPRATFQFFHHCEPEHGLELLAHPGVAAVAFTGGKPAGLAIKEAADRLGVVASLELSSLNPVVVLPSVLANDLDGFADALDGSARLGCGQFCTKPGLVFVIGDDEAHALAEALAERFRAASEGVLFSRAGVESFERAIRTLQDGGAMVLAGGGPASREGFAVANTALLVNGATFLEGPTAMSTEAFGPATMVVAAADEAELHRCLRALEGQLTGAIFGAGDESDAEERALARRVLDSLRPRVGRVIFDRMPTGVAVSPAMVHGGPFPASGHPGFSAVGMPGAVRRFAARRCYDHVPEWLSPMHG